MTKFHRENEDNDGWSDWIMPKQPIYKMMCCDCGLIHDIEFDIMFDEIDKKDKPIFKVRRNNCSTGQARRHIKNKQLTSLSANACSLTSKIYYADDRCTIYHGDCADILPRLAPVDCIATDPPYGINYLSNHYVGKNPHKAIINDDTLFLPVDLLWSKLKETGAMFAFYSHKKPLDDDRKKNVIIWVKNNWSAGDLAGDFGNQYECIAFMPKPKFKLNGKRLSNVWYGDRQKPELHPTQKPIKIMAKIIRCATKEGGTVLDPFAGAGATLLACKNLGRKAIGIEIEERYCEIAAQRLRQNVLF